MKRRVLVFVLALGVVLLASPASAHVAIKPRIAEKGSNVELEFEVPNEMDNADTVMVEVILPTDYPIPQVTGKRVTGWKVENTKTRITWSGGSISGDKSKDFGVTAGPIPSDTYELVFKVLQTYDNGKVVRWTQLREPDGEEPKYPAPKLLLVDPVSVDATNDPGENAAITETEDGGANSMAIGLVVGAAGIIALVATVAYRKRRSATSDGHRSQ